MWRTIGANLMKSLFTIDANSLSCVAMYSRMLTVARAQRALHEVGVAPFPQFESHGL